MKLLKKKHFNYFKFNIFCFKHCERFFGICIRMKNSKYSSYKNENIKPIQDGLLRVFYNDETWYSNTLPKEDRKKLKMT